MNVAEEHGWEALANVVPALGRDYTVEITSPGNNVYSCNVKFTYLNELGKAIAPFISERINNEMREFLISSVSNKDKDIAKHVKDTQFAKVEIIDGTNTAPAEPQEPEIIEPEPAPKPEPAPAPEKGDKVEIDVPTCKNKFKIPKIEVSDSTSKAMAEAGHAIADLVNKQLAASIVKEGLSKIQTTDLTPIVKTVEKAVTEQAGTGFGIPTFGKKQEFDIESEHWSGLFRAYIPSPDMQSYNTWITRLLVIEMNKRLVADKFTVLKLPDKFDKNWLENVDVAFTKQLYIPYGWLVKPSKFAELTNSLYEAVKMSASSRRMYNGTLRVIMSGTSEMMTVGAAYLTTTENN